MFNEEQLQRFLLLLLVIKDFKTKIKIKESNVFYSFKRNKIFTKKSTPWIIKVNNRSIIFVDRNFIGTAQNCPDAISRYKYDIWLCEQERTAFLEFFLQFLISETFNMPSSGSWMYKKCLRRNLAWSLYAIPTIWRV